MACGKVIGILKRLRTKMSISGPLRIGAVGADGPGLFTLRYASDAYSPTLYRSRKLDNGGITIASEPLDNRRHNYAPIMPLLCPYYAFLFSVSERWWGNSRPRVKN